MTLPVYFTGTVSVTNHGTTVTGAGVMWSGINAREGDYFVRADGVAVITEVTDQATLQITPWPGATVTGGTYAIEQNYVGRVVGVAAAEDVGVMLEKLHTDGLPFIVDPSLSAPDPSYGDEGQFAFQPSTGLWWIKQGGIWVPNIGLAALGYGGTSATSLVIGTGAKAFTTQTGLAYNGARVRAASAANTTNWMEGISSYSPTTGALTMTCDATGGSGTHADWLFSVAGRQGAPGITLDAPSDGVLYGRQQVAGSMTWTAAAGTGAPGGAIVSVTPPASPADGALWWESDTGILYLRYNDGNGPAQWVAVTATGGGGTGNAVRYDIAQGLTGEAPPYGAAVTQRSQARMNIACRALDALNYNGMQINGSMEVSQENGTTSLAVASGITKYICDGWKVKVLNTAVNAAMWRPSTPPTAGLPCALLMSVTTANSAPVANDQSTFMQRIEGYRVSRLGWGTANAQPITIGFWVAATRAGLFSGSISNDAYNRAYAFSYTIFAAATWEYKTITIPGDTVGTWVNDNSAAGLVLVLLMMGGPSVLTAPGAWGSTGYLGATGQVNCCAATTDWMEITGVVVLPGIEAPTAARSPLIMRPYDQELVTCQRYYEKTYDMADQPGKAYGSNEGGGAISSIIYATTSFAPTRWYQKTRKRARPTVTIYSPWTGFSGYVRTDSPATDFGAVASSPGEGIINVLVNNFSLSAGCTIYAHMTADARL